MSIIQVDDFKSFRSLSVSTITINIESNLYFNKKAILDLFINISELNEEKINKIPLDNMLSINHESILKTSELLSKCDEKTEKEHKELLFPIGTISYIFYDKKKRGIWKKKKAKKISKKNVFLNQVTLDIFTEKSRINVMIFINGKIKLAGCKNSNDAICVISILMDYLNTLSKILDLQCPISTRSGYDDIYFLFEKNMINISFSLPFVVRKPAINKLFNDLGCISFYEQTGQQYVNVKMNSNNKDKTIISLIIDKNNNLNMIVSKKELEPDKVGITSFMFFGSRVIMSGKSNDYNDMEKNYYELINIIKSNFNIISVS